MTAPTTTPSGQLWRCDGCNQPFLWYTDASYYGSLKEVDNGQYDRITVTCSSSCRDELIEIGQLPAFDRFLDARA